MKLEDLLKPEAVKSISTVSSKKMLLQSISELAESVHGLDSAIILRALQDRESLGPTGVGNGVALPHARIRGLTEVKLVFIRLDKPIDFGSVDRQAVDLLFALFAPENAGVDHLKALALISRTMRDSGTCAKLRANSNASTLHAILATPSRQQAA